MPLPDFEELDYRRTRLGELSLRRRRVLSLEGTEVYEVKLGDEFLMSSLFSQGEIALAALGLAGLDAGPLDVVVGGLGLGYTACAVLDLHTVREVLVIEALADVIRWHRKGLVPLGARLTGDARCRLINGDFFALARTAGEGFDPIAPGRRFHAVLLDVDHSPRELLHPGHAAFYSPAGLRLLTDYLLPGGVFALWSNDPPDDDFLQALGEVFASRQAHVVKFHNPLLNREAANTVYVAYHVGTGAGDASGAHFPASPTGGRP
jgi:spermidine synthase